MFTWQISSVATVLQCAKFDGYTCTSSWLHFDASHKFKKNYTLSQ